MSKQYKLTADNKKCIDIFKNCVSKHCSESADIFSVNFKEVNEDGEYALIAQIEYKNFVQKIAYYPLYLFEENVIDFCFHYENCPYDVMIYDIFNLFEINDFELYYYENCAGGIEIENAVDKIFNLTNNYFDEIETAGSNTFIKDIKANIELDNCGMNSGEYSEWEKEYNSPFEFKCGHPGVSWANGKITPRVHNRLSRKFDKDQLDTIYEKRLLKYLDSGKTVERQNITENEKSTRKISRYTVMLYAGFALLIFIILKAASSVYMRITFSGADSVFDEKFFKFFLMIFASVMLSIVWTTLFGKSIISKIYKNASPEKINGVVNKNESKGKWKIAEKAAVSFFGAALIVFTALGLSDGCGFYDEYIKVFVSPFVTGDINYENLIIYSVKGYDDEGSFKVYEDEYYMLSDGTSVYDFGNVYDFETFNNEIIEISKEYNLEIIDVNTAEDIPEYQSE